MPDGSIENVSDTAFWVAHYRAVESERADALFRDPLAGVLSGDRGRKIARSMPWPFMTGWVVALRTRIIDDYIGLGLAQGVEGVLNLGAGLDTRPYRMNLPESLLWIEADQPHLIEFKEQRLSSEKPRCRLERVKIDLANPCERRQLLESVPSRAKKMLVLTEGVIPYLSMEEVSSLADDLRNLAHACCWIVDYFSPEALRFRERGGLRRRMENAPFRFKPENWFGFFEEHGWNCKEIRYLAEEAERLKRPIRVPLVLRIVMNLRRLASKQRRAGLKRHVGYMLLEPAVRRL